MEQRRRDTECQNIGGRPGEGCNSESCVRPGLVWEVDAGAQRWRRAKRGPGGCLGEEHVGGRGQGKASDLGASWCFRATEKSQWDWCRNEVTDGRAPRDTKRGHWLLLREMGTHGRVANRGVTSCELHVTSITLCYIANGVQGPCESWKNNPAGRSWWLGPGLEWWRWWERRWSDSEYI